ncbi:c-type cytochrome [Anaeromyxobacter paludicola]|uniref:Cytochrome c domain-containing protein n=1 Tax=Anaeromyxobacter paludicola TaxID=2918171 RepID=A0ABM7XF30_9BACT|nr:cytochrome c [Anaeromyxobacter paludicola]BDG10508.1 hypothetical protein AMPC_36210 [Anaeromyxobacter paludicola]
MRFVSGMLFTLGMLVVGGAAVVASGLVDMSATRPPSALERLVGSVLADRSTARRAPRTGNPLPGTPEVLAAGLALYRRDCLQCHGAPGVSPWGAALGLNPSPPDLAAPDAQEGSDGDLFFVISHGVRMTGMPGWATSHDERELWHLVAFVRHLPRLAPAEKQALKAAAEAARR